jgi:hypothetical protein
MRSAIAPHVMSELFQACPRARRAMQPQPVRQKSGNAPRRATRPVNGRRDNTDMVASSRHRSMLTPAGSPAAAGHARETRRAARHPRSRPSRVARRSPATAGARTHLPYRGPTKPTKSVPNSPELGVISMLCLEDGTRPGAQRDGKSALPDEGRRAKLWQFQSPMRTSLRVHMLRIACRRRPGGAAPRGS